MILIESQDPVPPIYIKYMNEEGIKESARPILVLTCLTYGAHLQLPLVSALFRLGLLFIKHIFNLFQQKTTSFSCKV